MYGGVLPFRLRILTELVYGDANDNKDVWIQHYRAHNERVQQIIPAKQLLVMDISKGDGWEVLCGFLDHADGPCTDLTTPFPRDNTHEAREMRLAKAALAKPQYTADRNSRFAYVSMLAYPSEPDRRDYFMSFLVAVESIRQTGSTYDIVALLYGPISDDDMALLEAESIKARHCLFERPCT